MSELLGPHVVAGERDAAGGRGLADARGDQAPDRRAVRGQTEPSTRGQAEPSAPEPLWRELLGEQLRELRREHRESLAETAGRAGISPQYLSEVERGLKEPSSEMIAALAGALGTTLGGLAESVAEELRVQREARALVGRPELAGRDLAGRGVAGRDVARDELVRRDVSRDEFVRRAVARRRSNGPVMLALAA